jgi:hypothetical protein
VVAYRLHANGLIAIDRLACFNLFAAQTRPMAELQRETGRASWTAGLC